MPGPKNETQAGTSHNSPSLTYAKPYVKNWATRCIILISLTISYDMIFDKEGEEKP
jgi:hypothetical protein